MIAYNFPPVGGVGVQRTLKFATYLPRWGWSPVVLTASDPGVRPHDDDLVRRLPAGLVVERAVSPEPVKLRRALGRLARRVRPAATAAVPDGSRHAGTGSPGGTPRRGSGNALHRAWAGYTNLAFFPDEQVAWVPFAVSRGVRLCRDLEFDAIYSSGPPVSSHLAAGAVAALTGLPWLADFRDPWIGHGFAGPVTAWQGPLQQRLERAIVHRAGTVLTVTDGMRDIFAGRYPDQAGKLRVIANGYDRAEFGPDVLEAISARRRLRGGSRTGGRFKLMYAGTVYGENELGIFLEGVELLLARRPELRNRLGVEFVGWLNEHNQTVAASFDTPDRLAGVVTYSPFVPHSEALARMVQADALFHIIADEPGKGVFQSGKLPEYVGLDSQVLAFMPDGAGRAFLRELDWGIVEDPTPAGVAAGLERALETEPPDRPADPEGRYDRVNLTHELARLLDEMVGPRSS
jgi:hypothetical protein